MRDACGLTVLAWLLFTPLARASGSEEVALDKLPRAVTTHIQQAYTNAEVLQAWKETEDGKECYTVSIMYGGRRLDVYGSPDGRVLALKQDVFSFTELRRQLHDYVLLLLLPGAIAGALARWLIQGMKGNKLSALSEWFAAWCGAVLCIGILLSSVATVPRDKDAIVIAARCVVWGAISASLVEVLGLTIQSLRGYRSACRRWILGFSVVGCVFLAFSIPVDMLRIQRENQYFKALATKPALG